MKKNAILLSFVLLFSGHIWSSESKKIDTLSASDKLSLRSAVSTSQTVVVWGDFANAATGGGGGGIGGGGGGGGGTAAGGGGGYGGGAGGVVGGGGGGLNVGNSSISGGAGLGYGGIGGGGGMAFNSGGNGAGTYGKVGGGLINGAGGGTGGGIAGASKGGDGFGGGGGTSVGGGGAGITNGGEGFGAFGIANAGAGGSLGITPANLGIGTGNSQSRSTDATYTITGGVLSIFGGSGGGGGNVNSGANANGASVVITSQSGGTINLLGGVGGGGGMLSGIKGGNGAGSIITSATTTGGIINVFGGAGGGGNSIGLTGSKGGDGTGGQLLGGSISSATLNVYGGANGQNSSIAGFGTGTGGKGSGGYVSDFTLDASAVMNMYKGSNATAPNTFPQFGGNASVANNITNTGGALNLIGGTLQGTYNQSGGALNLKGGENNATCTFSGGSINNSSGTKDTIINATFTGGTVLTNTTGTDSLIFTNPTINGSDLNIGTNVRLSDPTVTSGKVGLNTGGTISGTYNQTGGTLSLNGGENNTTSMTLSGGTVNSTVSGATLNGASITGSVATDATPGSLLITNPNISAGGSLSLGKNVILEGTTGTSGNVHANNLSKLRSLTVNGSNVTMNTGSSIEGPTSVTAGSLTLSSGSVLTYDLANFTTGIVASGGTLSLIDASDNLIPSIDVTSVKLGVFRLVTASPGVFNNLNLSSIQLTYNGNSTFPAGYTPTFSTSTDGASLILTIGQSISNSTIEPIPNQVYTGYSITPDPVVMNGSVQLILDIDYQVSYSNNINTGNATVIITGIGSYSGTLMSTFTITPMPITVTADPQTKIFGGTDPALTYQVTSGVLGAGDSFTGSLSRSPGENVGSYTITQGTLSLPSNYSLIFESNELIITQINQTISFDTTAFDGKTATSPLFNISAIASSGLPLTYNSSNIHVATIDANGNITIVGAGSTKITMIQPGNSNYYQASASHDLVVTSTPFDAVNTTINLSFSNKPYTGSAITPSVSVLENGTPLTEGIDYTVSYVNNVNAGTATVLVTGIGNYTGTALTTFTIDKANLVVIADAQTKVYGTVDPILSYQITSGTLFGSDQLSGSLIRTPGENAGNYPIVQGTLAAPSNYNVTFIGNTFNISKANQTISFDTTAFEGKNTTSPSFNISATTTSGLPLSYSSSNPIIAMIDGMGNITYNNPGITTITIEQLGDANYNSALVTYDLVVLSTPFSGVNISVTLSFSSKEYNGLPVEPSVMVRESGTPLTESIDYTISYINNVNVGTATVLVSGVGTYSGMVTSTFVITPIHITVTADAQTKSYGVFDPVLSYQTSRTLIGGDQFTGNIIRNPGENVGTYIITQGSLALSPNYNLIYTANNLTITKANQVISFDASLLNNKHYGDSAFALTASASSGLPVTFTSSDPSIATVDNLGLVTIKKAGSVTIAASQIGNSNYNAAPDVSHLLTITPKSLNAGDITLVALTDQLYTGSPINPAITITENGSTLTQNVDFTANYSNNVNVGTATVVITGTGRYSGTLNTTFLIQPKPITVTANSLAKVYGEADPNLTFTITSGSLAPGDAFSGSLSRDPGENLGTYMIRQGTLSLSSNYTLTYIADYLSINKISQTIIIDESQFWNKKIGDGPFTIVVINMSGLPLSFSSSNPAVATVDDNGRVSILAEGVAYITISQQGNNIHSAAPDVIIKLNISNNPTQNIDIDKNSVVVYPNPVLASQLIHVKVNLNAGFDGAVVYLFDLSGKLIHKTNIVEPETNIIAPETSGIYVLKFVCPNGFEKQIKILVK